MGSCLGITETRQQVLRFRDHEPYGRVHMAPTTQPDQNEPHSTVLYMYVKCSHLLCYQRDQQCPYLLCMPTREPSLRLNSISPYGQQKQHAKNHLSSTQI